MTTVKKISVIGILSSLSVALSVLEQFVPLQAILPLPGVKLGIANVVIIFTLIVFTFKDALTILLIRCLVVSLLFGSPISLMMSLTGGLFAVCAMRSLMHFKRFFSLYGISMAGAAFHNIGQILCAAFWMRTVYVISYLPILLLVSVVTGLLIAVLAHGLLRIKSNINKMPTV